MTNESETSGAVWARDFSSETAARMGGDYLAQSVNARYIFDELELAIKGRAINVYAMGAGGMFEHPLRERENFPVGDYRVKRSTVEAWLASTPAAAPATQAVTAALPKQRAQEQRILQMLREGDHTPRALPKKASGARGVKADIKVLALLEPALFTDSSFSKAWERLRGSGEIADAA